MGMNIENKDDFFDRHEAQGNRELKYYKDIYGNDVRLLTTKEKDLVNKGLVIATVFVVILLSGFFYKAYLMKKEVEERTKLYMMSGESIEDGEKIVENGGIIISNDREIVDVTENGTIIAKSSGTTLVTIYKDIDRESFIDVTQKEINKDKLSIYDAYTNLGEAGEFTVEVTVKQVVTGVNLNTPSVNVYIGETTKLEANIFPHTAYDKDATWVSSDNTIATVDSNGVVTARNEGTVAITVTTKDGAFKDTTTVNVLKKKSNNNIYLSFDSSNFYIGDSKKIYSVVSPDNSLLSKLVYSSSDTSVATISSDGIITAKKKGTTTIKARIPEEEISTSIDIVVKDKILERIDLSSTNLSLTVGDSYTLKSYFYPNDAISYVTYTSNDSSIASVNSKGEVTALKEGITTIYAKGNNSVIAKCDVVVKNGTILASGLSASLEKNSISVGETSKIEYKIKPVEATDKKVTFVSSNSNVAVVSNDGVVTGVKPGNAIIMVTTSCGVSESLPIKVKVTDIKPSKITTSNNLTIQAGKSSLINTVIEPKNTTDKNIKWSSSNEDIAVVNSDGIVTGVNAGNCIITATLGNLTSTTNVNVSEIKVTGIDVNMSNINMNIGDTIVVKASISPVTATNTDVIWSSSDTNVIKVNNGRLLALKEGASIVKVVSKGNPAVQTEIVVNVSKRDVESFKLSHSQVLLTEEEKVNVKVSNILPKNADYKKAYYEIKDLDIASVDASGNVTGKKAGKTTLTVYVDGISKTIDVTIFEKGDKVYFIDTYIDSSIPSDAILFESNGKYAMIDTGSNLSSIKVVEFLHDLGVKKLEFILITHFHSGNFGGIYGKNETNNILLSDIKVKRVYMKEYSGSDSMFYDLDGKTLHSMSDITARRKVRSSMYNTIREYTIQNDISFVNVNSSINSLDLGNFDFDLYNTTDRLRAYSGKCLRNYNCDENSNSIVTYVSVNGRSLYLASDITNQYKDASTKYLKYKTEEAVANAVFEEHGKKVDIYKVSNNGYSDSNLENVLKNIEPRYSIITNSLNNFDSANDGGLRRIKKYTGNKIYYAGDGTVIANINKKGNIKFTQINK